MTSAGGISAWGRWWSRINTTFPAALAAWMGSTAAMPLSTVIRREWEMPSTREWVIP